VGRYVICSRDLKKDSDLVVMHVALCNIFSGLVYRDLTLPVVFCG
jgi:hypothetical protein